MGVQDVLGGLLGKESMARQFFVWNVAGAIVNAGLEPYLTALSSDVNANNPLKPLSPNDLADMVVRGVIEHAEAALTAAKSGVNGTDFNLLVQNTGEPPSALDMLQLMRRGKVARDDVVRAIKQSRIKDEWVDTILELGLEVPTPADILRATLQGQIDRDGGRALYEKLGGDPEYFQLMFNTEGSAPTPDQAATMANRGIIPWEGTGPDSISFHQAFLEGPWRDKWLEPYRKSAEYFPPPRTVTAMYNSGALNKTDAADLLSRQGLSPALVAAYLSDAAQSKTKNFKELAAGTIGTLYQDQAISDSEAKSMLIKLKYDGTEADFIILTWQLQREQKFRETAIGTAHTQYVNHKITRDKASSLLDQFHVPSNQRDYLLALWDQELSAKVTLLTAAEIKKAVTKLNADPQWAIDRLLQRGYSQEDAEIYMAI
jgi:hypothetical protein